MTLLTSFPPFHCSSGNPERKIIALAAENEHDNRIAIRLGTLRPSKMGILKKSTVDLFNQFILD